MKLLGTLLHKPWVLTDPASSRARGGLWSVALKTHPGAWISAVASLDAGAYVKRATVMQKPLHLDLQGQGKVAHLVTH